MLLGVTSRSVRGPVGREWWQQGLRNEPFEEFSLAQWAHQLEPDSLSVPVDARIHHTEAVGEMAAWDDTDPFVVAAHRGVRWRELVGMAVDEAFQW